MKQVLLVFLVCSLLLCACGKKLILPEVKNDYTIGIIGGADGPTAIVVGEQDDWYDDDNKDCAKTSRAFHKSKGI